MHFLPDIYVPCEQCHGKRYNNETLDIRFKGKTIADVLDMPVEEALEFFAHIPKIRRRLQTLHDVGLGYMRLGQPATTLSGGEAQRIKLASELAKVATGRTLYILDEPTTGLHFADIQKLLEVLQRLVDAGNSVVVIEHNLDVIKTADRIIDMGPEGGEEGGTLMATGTPEEIAAVESSYTGRFLRSLTTPVGRSRRPQARTAQEGRRRGLTPPGRAVSSERRSSRAVDRTVAAVAGRLGGRARRARRARAARGRARAPAPAARVRHRAPRRRTTPAPRRARSRGSVASARPRRDPPARGARAVARPARRPARAAEPRQRATRATHRLPVNSRAGATRDRRPPGGAS